MVNLITVDGRSENLKVPLFLDADGNTLHLGDDVAWRNEGDPEEHFQLRGFYTEGGADFDVFLLGGSQRSSYWLGNCHKVG